MTRTVRIGAGILVAIAAAGVFTATAVRAFWYDPSHEIAPPMGVARTEAAEISYPMHISVPVAHIDADIEQVGLVTPTDVAVPAHFNDAGWYKYGPLPGQVGTALIVGHVDNGLGLDGAFKHLSDLQPGDTIQVTTASSTVLTFKVDTIQTYPYNQVPTDVLFGASTEDGKAHLNLITCTGHWLYDASEGMTYDHRLIVSATLVPY